MTPNGPGQLTAAPTSTTIGGTPDPTTCRGMLARLWPSDALQGVLGAHDRSLFSGRRGPAVAVSPVSTAAAIVRTRAGSAITSISVIWPSVTMKLITANGRPRTVTTTPG